MRLTDDLSSREREVLALAADGLTNREIAERLGVAEETVKTFRQRANVKLGARNGTHAVVIAFREGAIR